MTTRRSILRMMGMAPIASAALSAEDAGVDIGGGAPMISEASPHTQKKIADALRRLAAGIDRGEMVANGFTVHSAYKANDPHFLEHVVTFNFELLGEKG